MFNKILIANRGEIACRIMRTAKRLGIKTVAVYSEADASARHVALADEAIAIGPAPASQSYLLGDRIIDAALCTQAEAIHPGYGFLAENAAFAEDCAREKLVFIGPPVEAMKTMGSKIRAKQRMQKAGVPLVPGYHGEAQSEARLRAEANKIGYPVLIKAAAGGGGKGMRMVAADNRFASCLDATKREAMAAFADDRVLLETYLVKPRHIEIQIFCDNKGNAVHLFERDCSVQRRHQKILEEAPAAGLDAGQREAMGRVALAVAQAIDYAGAGTVEFIVDADGAFYFMEMNTRLQVEHPVTELISGQDLVEWQLRVAGGETLPCTQDALSINGHAMEARIYAEDPERDFLPATGMLSHLRFPLNSRHVRVDTGIRQGDSVSVHYDPMIAKLIVWDRDRKGCLRRMLMALSDTQLVGVTTNIDFLSTLVAHPAFQAADVDTGFIEQYREQLFIQGRTINHSIFALATLYILLKREKQAQANASRSADPYSPWHVTNAWQANLKSKEAIFFRADNSEQRVVVHYLEAGTTLEIDECRLRISGNLGHDGNINASLDGTRTHATVVQNDANLTILHAGNNYQLEIVRELDQDDGADALPGSLLSPMPGKVIAVLAKKGAPVKKGQALLILEAMKMEHTIKAPLDGTVTAVHYTPGDMLDEGVELLVVEA